MKYQIAFCFCLIILFNTGVMSKDTRILSGSDANLGEFPYIVSLRYIIKNLLFCSGMIISERHILTAAHCLFAHKEVYHLIRIYPVLDSPKTTFGPIHKIEKVTYHSNFTEEMSETNMNINDIAVIKTQKTIIFNILINKVNLPTAKVEDYVECMMSGWGTIEFPGDVLPETLQKLDMRIVPRNLCLSLLPFSLHPGQICGYKSTGMGSCNGDSGGPLICNNILAGIISFNLPCAQGFPDIFTDVHYYLEFIRAAMID